MTRTEEIRDRFVKAFENGEDLGPILDEYRGSKSVLYEGMALAFTESLREYKKLQEERFSLREEVNELTQKKGRLAEETQAVAQLEKKHSKLEREVADKKAELDDLKNQWETLVKTKFVTPEQMGRIVLLEFETGKQLLERVETAAKHQKLLEEKAALEDSIGKLKTELEDLKKRYDDAQLSLKQFRVATEIVIPFFDEGYTNEHFLLLFDGLKKVWITGEPQHSITRLLQSMDFNKKLSELDEELEKKRGEKIQLQKNLEELEERLAEAKGALEAVKDTVLKEVNDAEKQGVATIQEVGASATNQITLVSNSFTKDVNETLQKIEEYFATKKAEIEQWGATKEELGIFAREIGLAKIFLTADKMRAEDLKVFAPKDMALFLRYFLIWVEKACPGMKIKPDETLRKEMRYISEYSDFDLAGIVKWIIREFLTIG